MRLKLELASTLLSAWLRSAVNEAVGALLDHLMITPELEQYLVR